MQLPPAVIAKAMQQSRSSAAPSIDRTLLLHCGNFVTELNEPGHGRRRRKSSLGSRLHSAGDACRDALLAYFAEDNTVAMISLALCHQAADMLYLHLSCSPGTSNQQIDFDLLSSTHQNLTMNLSRLLAQTSLDIGGPIHNQLHKFVTWPLIIAAYARVGYDVCAADDRLGGDADRDLERLQHAALAIRS
jgi:hypothetical protein